MVTAARKKPVKASPKASKTARSKLLSKFRTDSLASFLEKAESAGVHFDEIWARTAPPQRDELDRLYETDDLVAKDVDEEPDDAIARGITIAIQPERGEKSEIDPKDLADIAKAIHDRLEEMDVLGALADWRRTERLNGGALLLLGVSDTAVKPGEKQRLDKPINEAAIISFRRLHVLEHWGVKRGPPVRDILSPYFGQPEYYDFPEEKNDTGKEIGMGRVHCSRVIVAHGIRPRGKRAKEKREGWGAPYVGRSLEPIEQYRSNLRYTAATYKRFTETWIKIHGLLQIASKEGGDDDLLTQLELMAFARSVLGIVPIDGEDEVVQHAVEMSSADGMCGRNMEAVTSALKMPLTKAFGHAPAGLSTDDESGTRNWHAVIHKLQKRQYLPALNRIIDLLLVSQDGPTTGRLPGRYQVIFNPLEQETREQQSKRRYVDSQTAKSYVDQKAVDPQEIRNALRADPESPYQLMDDEEMAEKLAKAEAEERAAREALANKQPGAPVPDDT